MSGFHIPDRAITYPVQSRWFESDTVILGMSAGGHNGVIEGGCEVTESTIPAGTTEVEAGQVVVNGSLVDVAAQTVGHDIADALLDRLDLVVAYNDGTCVALAGTSDAAPLPPLPDTDSVALAQVTIPAGDTAITNGQIVDKRVFVDSPLAASPWIVASATTDLARTSNATLTIDPILQLAVTNGGTYRVKMSVWWTLPATNITAGLKYGLTAPTLTRATGFHGLAYPGTGSLGHSNLLATQLNNTTLATATGNAVEALMQAEFFLLAAATGTVGITWSQNAANALPLTRRKGSLLEYQIV